MTTNKNESYTGKVAFVTGAANGIGRATALAFAREDASVVIADVSEDNQETARMIEELGGRALAVKCDVSRAEDVKAALDKAVEKFDRLDFAFNNEGIEQPIRYIPLYHSQSRINTTSEDLLDVGEPSHYIAHCHAQHFQAPAFSILFLLLSGGRRAMAQEIHEANRPPQGVGVLHEARTSGESGAQSHTHYRAGPQAVQ
jgi:NAD(P)-dependent dehydrogenase (short-subunit alcohol dehydrogenase family)